MRLQDYTDISEAPDVKSLEERLVNFAGQLDFGIISGALVVEHGVGRATSYHLGNTPEAFANSFASKQIGQRDPVMQRLKRLSAPFVYDQSLYVREDAADLWDNQAQYGYKTGIAMALHLPGGRHFIMGVDRDQPLPRDDAKITRMMADLQLLAVHAQETAIRLFVPKEHGFEVMPDLSPIELDILRWTSEGKSLSVIAQIMNITEASVKYHVGKSLIKLDVGSKVQAVSKAKVLGLI